MIINCIWHSSLTIFKKKIWFCLQIISEHLSFFAQQMLQSFLTKNIKYASCFPVCHNLFLKMTLTLNITKYFRLCKKNSLLKMASTSKSHTTVFQMLHPATVWSMFEFLQVNYKIWSMWLWSSPAGRCLRKRSPSLAFSRTWGACCRCVTKH